MDRDAARKREAGFLSREGDAAAVYRFDTGAMADSPVPLEQARSTGESPIISGYDLIATGPIMRGADALAILEEYRANGFARPGDVVSFKQDGVVTCWYVVSAPVIKCKKAPRKKCSFVAEVKGKR